MSLHRAWLWVVTIRCGRVDMTVHWKGEVSVKIIENIVFELVMFSLPQWQSIWTDNNLRAICNIILYWDADYIHMKCLNIVQFHCLLFLLASSRDTKINQKDTSTKWQVLVRHLAAHLVIEAIVMRYFFKVPSDSESSCVEMAYSSRWQLADKALPLWHPFWRSVCLKEIHSYYNWGESGNVHQINIWWFTALSAACWQSERLESDNCIYM